MEKDKSLDVEIEESIDKNRVSSSKSHGVDVRALKIALNKLYFYTPPLGKGITSEVDDKLFEAIKAFQRRYFIPQEHKITNDSLTLRRLDEELDSSANFQLFKRSYVWKTTQDKHVRGSHAVRAGQVFSWDKPPVGGHPGEDFGCRCWAEPIVPMRPKKLNIGYDDVFDKTFLEAQYAINPVLPPELLIELGLAAIGIRGVSFRKNILSKQQIDTIEALRGMNINKVERLADNTFLKQGWKKALLKRGKGVKYYDGKGGSFQLNRGYKGSTNVHGGPYIKTTVGDKVKHIPLKGNPVK